MNKIHSSIRCESGLALALTLCALLFAPSVSVRAQTIAPIDLPSGNTKTVTSFASVLNVVELADGTVAVNDATARQLVFFDRTLSAPRVILDSALTQSSYGRNGVATVACNCLEVWFPDLASKSIIAFDQNGAQKRVLAAPSAADFLWIVTGRTIADTVGHLVYRGAPARVAFPTAKPDPNAPPGNPDSTALLRANFETRMVDTIARLRTLHSKVIYFMPRAAGAETPGQSHILVDILAPIDEWTALPDGTVAVVRGHDYHVDWLLPNGKIESSPKLPFDFKRLTDQDKAALMDSARKAELAQHRADYDRIRAAGATQTIQGARAASSSGGSSSLSDRAPMTVKIGEYVQPVVDSVPFDHMPDYYPPIRNGAVAADLDGNVWILPTTSAQSRGGELVYDVVNRARGLVARVRVPAGRSIAGFGKNGAVYLISRDANGRWFVERSALPKKM